jgi:hypothetical protein
MRHVIVCYCSNTYWFKKMKVTVLIPDDLTEEAMKLSKSASFTDALKTALATYIRMEEVKD